MPDVAASFVPRLPASGPFLPPASGGAGMPSVKFVDPATSTPLADQTGSDEAPFATVAAAIEALVLVGGGVVLLAPAQYPLETITPSVPTTPICLRGLSYEDAPPCDLGNVSLNLKAALAVIDVFALGDCTYRDRLYVNNSNLHNIVFDGEAPAGDATLFNSTANMIECDTGRATDCTLAFFFCTASTFLTRTNVSVQLTCGGNPVIEGTAGQFAIPPGTDFTTGVGALTAIGYNLTDTSCFRYQWVESCQLSGSQVVTSAEAMPLRNCEISPGCNFDGPAGAIVEMDGNTYADFLRSAGTTSGGLVIKVVDGQQRITLSIAVPVLAAGVSAYVNTSLAATDLAGMQQNDPVLVNPQQDVQAAGANGGGLRSFRMSAANTLRCEFQGVTTAGAQNFTVTKL